MSWPPFSAGKAIPDDTPLLALERRFGRALVAFFLEEFRRVLEAASNGNYHHPSDEELATVMRPYLFDATNLGVDAAEKPLLSMGMGFDTALVNEAAVSAARDYSYTLVRGINDTTRATLQKYVSEYVAQPTRIEDLGKKLAPTFGKKRAGVIATTETTRAYATAQEATWQEVNRQYGSTIITGMQWLTANDEIVCPICAPLGGLVFDARVNEAVPQDEAVQEANARVKPLGGKFTHPGGAGMAARFAGGEYDRPPAHPNCRCSLQPWVEDIPNA